MAVDEEAQVLQGGDTAKRENGTGEVTQAQPRARVKKKAASQANEASSNPMAQLSAEDLGYK